MQSEFILFNLFKFPCNHLLRCGDEKKSFYSLIRSLFSDLHILLQLSEVINNVCQQFRWYVSQCYDCLSIGISTSSVQYVICVSRHIIYRKCPSLCKLLYELTNDCLVIRIFPYAFSWLFDLIGWLLCMADSCYLNLSGLVFYSHDCRSSSCVYFWLCLRVLQAIVWVDSTNLCIIYVEILILIKLMCLVVLNSPPDDRLMILVQRYTALNGLFLVFVQPDDFIIRQHVWSSAF